MEPAPAAKTPLEMSMDALTRALEKWDPDTGGDVSTLLVALRELDLRFDPRRDRLSAALCVTSMKLLESIAAKGSVDAAGAVGAVSELARGLRETLTQSAAVPTGTVPANRSGPTITLKAPLSSTGLSLSMRSVENRSIGELMMSLNMLSAAQHAEILKKNPAASRDEGVYGQVAVELGYATPALIESAQRLQSRSRGATPAPKSGDDPWGDRPL
jgi:hypothetical protein